LPKQLTDEETRVVRELHTGRRGWLEVTAVWTGVH
jgi:hypothetical protein